MAVGIIDNAASDQIINQAQRVVDMWPTIGLLEPDEHPLMVALRDSKIQERPAYSSKIEWLIDELHPRYADLSATPIGVTGTINTLGTGQAAYFKAGDQCIVQETQETVIVLTTDNAQTITVQRGWAVVAMVQGLLTRIGVGVRRYS